MRNFMDIFSANDSTVKLNILTGYVSFYKVTQWLYVSIFIVTSYAEI